MYIKFRTLWKKDEPSSLSTPELLTPEEVVT